MQVSVTPKFPTVSQSLHADLRKRVYQYFDERGIVPTGNPKLFTKAITMVVAFVLVYIHLVFFQPSLLLALIECVFLGGLIAAIGFNVMHDGSHG
ncbi:MAG: acyl-CoA desaturase, partial [Chitinophagaceae bacterium]